MKKIIIVRIIAAVIISSGIIIILKTTMGDQATEIPGEEIFKKTLNLQENDQNEYGESESQEKEEHGDK